VCAPQLPFRTNNYVVEELIDWNNVPEDPIFQLTFPQPGMLPAEWLEEVHAVRMGGGTAAEVRRAADKVRAKMNPHPAKQREMNVPNHKNVYDGETEFERGMQHKYRETVLFFPSEAQYCHSYCTYCFRWAQFVGSSDMQFASNAADELVDYLRTNPDVSDLLMTGGDPMVLNSKQLGKYLDSVASDPTLDHIQTIRIGSKSLAYWPYKYVTDDDADDMMALLERVVKSGKHISLMAHFSHPAELSTPVVREAIRRLRATGIQIRCQAPLINHINNDGSIWSAMWREQVKLGMIPYYMFIERDTGARHYFAVPLYKAHQIYSEAIQSVSGLARTARGPSMSCVPGKVCVVGVEEIANEKVFVLKFLQSRNPDWQERVFFAQYSETAIWMDDLKPAFGQDKFFFEDEIAEMEEASLHGSGSSGQIFQSVAEEPPLDLGTASLTDMEALAKTEQLSAVDADTLLEELGRASGKVVGQRGIHTDSTAR
jgi:KamA family protein